MTNDLLFLAPIIELIIVLYPLGHLLDLDLGFDRGLRVFEHLAFTADQILTVPTVQWLVDEAARHE